MNQDLRIFFVRHGETAWTLSGQHTGHTDVPLTMHGERMARSLAAPLAIAQLSTVLTSPSLRSRQTCALAGLGSDARIEPKLAEWDYGDYEGMRTAQIRLLHPEWDIWDDGCPHGESPHKVGERADSVIDQLLALEGNVGVFSHGQFGRALAARWIGLALIEGRHFAIDPASIGILGFEASHRTRRVIALWNCSPPQVA